MNSVICSVLFQCNLSALCLKSGLDILGSSLVSLLLNNLGSVVNNILSLLQAKAGYLTYNLDNLYLVRANLCQLYVELGLLLCCRCVPACCRNYNTCRCRYAELLFTCFY